MVILPTMCCSVLEKGFRFQKALTGMLKLVWASLGALWVFRNFTSRECLKLAVVWGICTKKPAAMFCFPLRVT